MPRDFPADRRPSEPWLSFLTDLDAALDGPADFHCIGGFVVSQHYGFARETANLDVLTVIPPEAAERVAALAGRGSPLQRKHRVYIDHVGVANYPDDYETRLVRVFPLWPNVRLWALEPHDLALTKLERSNDRDIRDVMYLAQAGLIVRDAHFTLREGTRTVHNRANADVESHDSQDVGGGLLADRLRMKTDDAARKLPFRVAGKSSDHLGWVPGALNLT